MDTERVPEVENCRSTKTMGFAVQEIVETVTIKNKLGLHARPAALLVQTASKYTAKIELESDDLKVNGKSIMGVMMLAAGFGSKLTVYATGEDATDAISGIRTLIDSKFDEE